MGKININRNLERIIVVILIVLGIFHYCDRVEDQNNKYNGEVKLRQALQDSVRTYLDREGNLISEKKTLQGDIKYLQGENVKLNKDQAELLEVIEKINKDRKRNQEVFAAASIRYKKFIDSLNNYVADASEMDTVENTISFTQKDTTSDFQYNIVITNVRQYPKLKTPTINFMEIDFPNKQTVTFNFDKDKRKDYPISFSVMNSNPYYKVNNIESYSIEGLKKENVNPTGWQKFAGWFEDKSKYLIFGGLGFAAGVALSR